MAEQHKLTARSTMVVTMLFRIGFFLLLSLPPMLIPESTITFHLVMVAAFCFIIPHALWLRCKAGSQTIVSALFLVDLLVVSLLVYFTGGIHSGLMLLYPLIILSASISGTTKQAIKTTLLGTLTYVLMGSLLLQDLLIQCLPDQVTRLDEAQWPDVVLRSCLFAIFGVAGIFIAKKCGYHEYDQPTSEKLDALLLAIPTPAFLLHSDGAIRLANHSACDLIDRPANELYKIKFTDLLTDGPTPIPESYGQSGYLARNNNRSPLPVAYSSVNLEEMAFIVSDFNGQKDTIKNAVLVVLIDISHPLKLEQSLEKVDQITAATRLAGEMAHEIRTPLTSISASIQLLKHYEEQATATDWLPNSKRRRDREELFLHIEDASNQLDSVIQNFVDFAEFTPKDLLSIIKLDSAVENHGYIGHLNTIGRDLSNGKDSDSGRRPNNPEFVEQDPYGKRV